MSSPTIVDPWAPGEDPLSDEDKARILNEEEIAAAAVTRLHPEREQNDTGNARRLVEAHGDDLRFETATKRWLVWDGRAWRPDTSGQTIVRAKALVDRLVLEAATLSPSDRRTAMKHALASGNAGRLHAMVDLAASEPGIAVDGNTLDADPWALNVANGLLDLRTGELSPHRRDALCSRLTPVPYDPNAAAPTWHAFLERVLPDPELRAYLQRLAGYILTGDVGEQILPLLLGAGANGKSVWVEVLTDVLGLGEYAISLPSEVLVPSRTGGNQPPGLLALRGIRLATTSESDEGAKLSIGLVKRLTGGDSVSVRPLYSNDVVVFRPVAKYLLVTNHEPSVSDTSEGAWRRLRIVPFSVTIPEPERDHRLRDKIRDELPGVLAWAVAGTLAWQHDGLGHPDAIRDATSDYRTSQDPFGEFVTDWLFLGPVHHRRGSDVYAAWRTYCTEVGANPGTAGGLLTRLAASHGVKATRTKTERIWDGVDLRRESGDR